MKDLYKHFLFSKHILVHEANYDNNWSSKPIDGNDDFFPVLITLGQKFGIRINKNPGMATMDMIRIASEELGVDVPAPFYRGFPGTVRELTPNQLLYDQLLHYAHTYGCGWFEEPGHSVVEGTVSHPGPVPFERIAYNESVPAKDFIILPEEEATNSLKEAIRELMASNRPMNSNQIAIATTGWSDFGKDILPEWMACKDTVINFLYATKDMSFCRYLKLSDVIKLLAHIQHVTYLSDNLKKLNLKNQDRKFITSVIDNIVKLNCESKKVYFDFDECFEKRKIWCGLLHHIHYHSNYETMKLFISDIRSNENCSAYSRFEHLMASGNIYLAVRDLMNSKGASDVIRHLDYILSRCKSDAEIASLFAALSEKKLNPVVLIQIFLRYKFMLESKTPEWLNRRSFVFTKNNKLRVHKETDEEVKKRKTSLPKHIIMEARNNVEVLIRDTLKDRLGKVYVDPSMYSVAVPIDMSSGESGFGVLTTGSRMPIPEGKFVRAFTYWEKVNDIDLSCFAINRDGEQREFSWRNMAYNQGEDITYSGDQTSGYNGGSEFFDIDIEKFRQNHPDFRYIVFCNNVYSGIDFRDCVCRAGFMVRSEQNAPCWKGERSAPMKLRINDGLIFDPKTVQTSFRINAESTFAYLFAIDLEKREMIWLNKAKNDRIRVAGTTSMDFLLRYFDITNSFNVGKLYLYAASEIVSDPEKADVFVSDKEPDPKVLLDNPDIEVVHSWDIEKMLRLLQP